MQIDTAFEEPPKFGKQPEIRFCSKFRQGGRILPPKNGEPPGGCQGEVDRAFCFGAIEGNASSKYTQALRVARGGGKTQTCVIIFDS